MNSIKRKLLISMAVLLSAGTLTGCDLDLADKLPFLSKNSKAVIEEEPLKAFNAMDLDVPLADVIVRIGEEYRMDIERSEGYPVKAKVKNKKLIVRRAEEKSKGSCKLEISMPKKAVLKQGVCLVDVGDVKMEGITAAQMKIKINVGDCTIKKCNIQKLKMHSETGDVLLDKPVAIRKTVLKLASEQGTITVNGKDHKSPFRNRRNTSRITRLSTNLGDIEVRREGYEKMLKAKEKSDSKKSKAGDKSKNTKKSKSTKDTKKTKNKKGSKNTKQTKNTKKSKNTKQTKKSNSKSGKNKNSKSKKN